MFILFRVIRIWSENMRRVIWWTSALATSTSCPLSVRGIRGRPGSDDRRFGWSVAVSTFLLLIIIIVVKNCGCSEWGLVWAGLPEVQLLCMSDRSLSSLIFSWRHALRSFSLQTLRRNVLELGSVWNLNNHNNHNNLNNLNNLCFRNHSPQNSSIKTLLLLLQVCLWWHQVRHPAAVRLHFITSSCYCVQEL